MRLNLHRDKNINFGFYPYTDVCEHCILSTFQSPVNKYHRHVTRVGFEPTTLAILEQCLTNIDYRDCPVASGTLNPMFWHVKIVPNQRTLDSISVWKQTYWICLLCDALLVNLGTIALYVHCTSIFIFNSKVWLDVGKLQISYPHLLLKGFEAF